MTEIDSDQKANHNWNFCFVKNYYESKMFPHLYGFRVNISLFQEAASKELLEILDKCDGPKVCLIH